MKTQLHFIIFSRPYFWAMKQRDLLFVFRFCSKRQVVCFLLQEICGSGNSEGSSSICFERCVIQSNSSSRSLVVALVTLFIAAPWTLWGLWLGILSKDCWWRLTFREPVQRPSSESSFDFRTGCRNLSRQQKSFSGLPSPRLSFSIKVYYSWVHSNYAGFKPLVTYEDCTTKPVSAGSWDLWALKDTE